MQKRLILAIGFSLCVLMIWSILFPVQKPQHIAKQQVIEKNIIPSQAILAVPTEASFIYTTETMDITFALPSATIQAIYFKKYNYQTQMFNQIGLLYDNTQPIAFSDYKIDGNNVIFSSRNHKIIKTFIIPNASYTIKLKINNVNGKANYWLNIADIDLSKNARQMRASEVVIFSDNKPQKFPLYKFKNQEKHFSDINVKIAGIHDTHFCYLLKNNELRKNNLNIIPLNHDIIRFSQSVSNEDFSYFFGPKDKSLLYDFDSVASDNLAHFNAISRILLSILKFLYLIFRNWGLAIVILSILIYGLLYPLTHKQMQSMKEMQALQPHIENLRKIYKDNPQRLNKEIVELYKEHKVNPMGGCLPLLLQIPIFFALYQALSRSLLLKGARFLWINDLTEPDKLFILPKSFPVIGNEINLLPILMALTMFLQQKLSLKSASPTQREQQKMMMVIFPIIFGFIFYSFPAGLVIYWFINSLLTLVYQWKVSK
ncbi:MAG: membrane protein insertase YidC [Candidatus Omnitrophota bacterium]